MKRRDIIKNTALLSGAALSAPLMSALLGGCKTDEVVKTASGLNLFSGDEMELLKEIVDTILPKTDSPSATEVGVHTMIDHMMGKVFKKEVKESFKENFTKLSSYLTGQSFAELSADEKLKVLAKASNDANVKSGLQQVKQQAIAYYLSSETIGENYLNYLPVPGAWEPCISLEEAGGKKWAI